MQAQRSILAKLPLTESWTREVGLKSEGHFQPNQWTPDPPPTRNVRIERIQREFLANWGPPVGPEAGNAPLQDLDVQCDAISQAEPKVISSIMGFYEPKFVSKLKAGDVERMQI